MSVIVIILRDLAACILGIILVGFLALVIIMVLQKAAAPDVLPLRATAELLPAATNVVELPGDLDTPGQFAEDQKAKGK